MSNPDIESGKTVAIVSYLTIFGLIIAYFMNDKPKSSYGYFHIRQSLGLWATFFVINLVISQFDHWGITIGWYIFFWILFFYSFFMALTGKQTPTPLLGDFYQKLFKGLGPN